jgi:hypothetical protein
MELGIEDIQPSEISGKATPTLPLAVLELDFTP